MAPALVILYVTLSFLSPAAFPPAIASLRINLIVGMLAILSALPRFASSGFLKQPDVILLAGFLLACVISLASTGWLGSIPPFLSNFLPVLLVYPLVAVSCNDERSLKWMVNALTCVAFYILVMAFRAEHSGNYLSPYLISQGVGEGGTLYRYRGLGVLSDPNDTAQFLLVVAVMQWLRWKQGRTMHNALYVLVPVALLLAGIYMTHSRGGVLACLAALLFALKRRMNVVLTGILAFLAVATILLLNVGGGRGIGDDDGDRVGLWSNGLTMLRSHPLFGIGPANFGDHSDNGLTAHNSYVLALAETGFVGYTFWIALILLAWGTLSRQANASRTVPTATVNVPAQMQIALVGFLAAAFFLSRTYSMLLYVLIGLAAALRLNEARASPPPEQSSTARLLLRGAGMGCVSVFVLYVAVNILR